MQTTVVRSKVDWWIGGALVMVAVAPLAVIAGGITTGETEGLVGGLVSLGVSAGILGGLVLPMRYTLGEESLEVRFGLVRVRIPYSAIRAVERSGNPISSPALSLHRIRIDYAKPNGRTTFVLISPLDRDAFIRELRTRARLPA